MTRRSLATATALTVLSLAPAVAENLRVVERFTRTDANTLTYQATIEDPTVFTAPWTIEIPMGRGVGPLFEVACHEGNYGLANILSGHRAQERAAAQ